VQERQCVDLIAFMYILRLIARDRYRGPWGPAPVTLSAVTMKIARACGHRRRPPCAPGLGQSVGPKTGRLRR
jgi:hypothetical protein